MRKYNQVYFNNDTVEYTKGLLSQNFINKWGIKFKEPTDGCVRTKNGKVIAFYFYINTTNQNNAITNNTKDYEGNFIDILINDHTI